MLRKLSRRVILVGLAVIIVMAVVITVTPQSRPWSRHYVDQLISAGDYYKAKTATPLHDKGVNISKTTIMTPRQNVKDTTRTTKPMENVRPTDSNAVASTEASTLTSKSLAPPTDAQQCKWPIFINSIVGITKEPMPDCPKINGVDRVSLVNGTLTQTKKGLKCTAKIIVRNGDKEQTYGREIDLEFNKAIKMKDEFFSVTCSDGWTSHYRWVNPDLPHNDTFVPLAAEEDARQNALHGGGLSSVIMLIFDSVSHIQMTTQMPKVTSLLKEWGGVELDGYNIVADGTTGNLMALLAGMYPEDSPFEVRKGLKDSRVVDALPFIHHKLHERGYPTLHDEDSNANGAFQYRLNGFDKPLATAYTYAWEQMKKATNRKWYRQRFDTSKGPSSEWECIGDQHQIDHTFAYFDSFTTAFPPEKRPISFALMFHKDFTHDYNKLPSLEDNVLKHLHRLRNDGRLNTTTFILMSDHGSRFPAARGTLQGKLEERLPYMNIVLPKNLLGNSNLSKPKQDDLLRQMRSNLVSNSVRLTSPFDIHATLRHLLLNDPTPYSYGSKKQSLARSLLTTFDHNETRTCESLSISPTFCVCQRSSPLENSSDTAKKAAAAFLKAANAEMNANDISKQLCEQLFLIEIVSAKSLLAPSTVSNKATFIELTLRAGKADGHFEVTVPVSLLGGKEPAANERLKLLADSSRSNRYSDQPKCVEEKLPHLRKFCLCKDHEVALNSKFGPK